MKKLCIIRRWVFSRIHILRSQKWKTYSSACAYISEALMFSGLMTRVKGRDRSLSPPQGMTWLLPWCSDGPESCPFAPQPHGLGKATEASGFCSKSGKRPQSSLWALGAWMPVDGQREESGAHRRWWPWMADSGKAGAGE